MRDTDHYARLMGIQAPWYVSLVELDEDEQTVTIVVRFDRDAPLKCPKCRRQVPGYDQRRRVWRHLDTMQFGTFVEADVPRVECPEHGVTQIPVPWAEDSSRYSAAFETRVIAWLKDASISAVATNLKLSWNAVDGIMQRAVARGLKRRARARLVHLSVDETSFQRRHEYVTVVTDQRTGAVLYVGDDRTKQTLAEFFEDLSTEERQGIESVAMDMWPAYIGAVREYVPEADEKICFDKFHVAKYLGDGVDRVRRAEHKKLNAQGDERLKGTRFRWLEHPSRTPAKLLPSFRELRDSALATAKAWALKEHAMCLWNYVSRTWAKKAWAAWIGLAQRSALAPMRKVAETIGSHLWGIINAIVLKRTNAAAESANSRIQKVKQRACGFRNRERFRTAILFHLGQLDLIPNPVIPA